MHLSILVIDGNILLQTLCNSFVTYDCGAFSGEGIHHNLQNVEQFPSISATLTEERISLLDSDVLFPQNLIFLQCPVQQNLQVARFERLEDKDLTTGKQRSDNLEGRVLGSCSDQDENALLHGSQQCILLSLVETVDFIYEKHRSSGS